jgi:hypothetical protein
MNMTIIRAAAGPWRSCAVLQVCRLQVCHLQVCHLQVCRLQVCRLQVCRPWTAPGTTMSSLSAGVVIDHEGGID